MEMVRQARMKFERTPIELEQPSRSGVPRLRYKNEGCVPVRNSEAASPTSVPGRQTSSSASTVPAGPPGQTNTKSKTNSPSSGPRSVSAHLPAGKTATLPDKPSLNPALAGSAPAKSRAGGHGAPTNSVKGSSQRDAPRRTPPPSTSSNAAGPLERPKLRLAIPYQLSE